MYRFQKLSPELHRKDDVIAYAEFGMIETFEPAHSIFLLKNLVLSSNMILYGHGPHKHWKE